ncbi:L-seryl-tRNA(Sec) selenium transferase [Streptomyces sp. NPDC127074]|uniref:L-seryl-tRNA(Sec) selenium transferase n=1 Tax=Streptomyces sp. NPDC127074 TaxID=3347130 RepID=UPI003668AF97
MADPRRQVPRTDALLAAPELRSAIVHLGRAVVKGSIRAAQERARCGEIAPGEVLAEVRRTLPGTASSLQPVINATGIIVHTNLGRAPLSAAAVDAVVTAAGNTDVEFELSSGTRARRGRGAREALLAAVPEAGDAHVVNNNAAALALAALALAQGREIVISRGELVAIGDGFRLPELMESTGARLREVGTTNRTTLDDYASAVGEDTAFVLKVHPSNFAVTGFVQSVDAAALSALDVPLVVDVGSGLLRRDSALPREPDVRSTLRAGAALVTASGDKLLGGPQAGLIFGDAELVRRLARHPLARALRTDKLTLAALEATVCGPRPPVSQALHAQLADLRARADGMAAQLGEAEPHVSVVDSTAMVGGGGAPEEVLPSVALSLPERYGPALRLGTPPIVGRVSDGRCLLDLRTIDPLRDHQVVLAVRGAS